jgi:hypothetical protein
MDHSRFHRFRALVLLVALTLGFAGQTVAAMAMAAQPPTSSMTMPGGCSGCVGTADDMSLSPVCAVGFCANLPAVAADGSIVETSSTAIYPLIASDFGPGVSIPPDPGPPKPLHHR